MARPYDGDYLRGKFGRAIALSTRMSTMHMNAIVIILLGRSPFQIGSPVIKSIPVEVAAFIARRTGTDKRF
jgi:hypothetical protein